MKKKKIRIAILCALVAVLLLAGCGVIEVKDTAKAPESSADLKGMALAEVKAKLADAGFSNVETQEAETRTAENAGTVKEISINGKSSFKAGDAWAFDTPVKITYYVLKQFEPTMEIEVSGDEGKPVFTIKTNLPYQTKLLLTLTNNDDFDEQQTVTVSNGEARSKKFTDIKDLPLAEKYTLTVVMSMEDQDGATVRRELGENGECLTGALVERNSVTGQPYVFMEYEYTSRYTRAEVDRYKDQLSLDEIVFALEMQLAGADGTEYRVAVTDGVLVVDTWYDGAALTASVAATGEQTTLEAWNTLTTTLTALSEKVQALLNDNGHRSVSSRVNLANDVNQGNTLFSASDGKVIYDYVYGIDLVNVGG